MLINLRNALMAGKRLPYDAEVEYLDSTGTQYIDTGVLATEVFGCKLSVEDVATTVYNCFIQNYTTDDFCIGSVNGNTQSSYIRIRRSLTWAYNIGSSKTFSIFGGVINANGAQIGTYDSTLSLGANANNIGLFGSPTGARPSKCRIFSCKLYDSNGVLVRDYIPVRKGTVGYLYDRVSGALFGNAGTGDFVLGPDVVPVEYIMQTGTQYIDTLYPMADTRREVITVDWSGHSTTYREFMAGAASGSYLIEMSRTGYYGTAYNDYSSIHVSTKDKIRWDYTVGVKPYLYINDVFAIQDSLLRVPTGNIQTGGVGTPGANFPKMKIYSLDVYTDNSVQVRKMRPVRVGTEGAMMDTLTRRIYRNAGTGAFGYGNDLPYPIPA